MRCPTVKKKKIAPIRPFQTPTISQHNQGPPTSRHMNDSAAVTGPRQQLYRAEMLGDWGTVTDGKVPIVSWDCGWGWDSCERAGNAVCGLNADILEIEQY